MLERLIERTFGWTLSFGSDRDDIGMRAVTFVREIWFGKLTVGVLIWVFLGDFSSGNLARPSSFVKRLLRIRCSKYQIINLSLGLRANSGSLQPGGTPTRGTRGYFQREFVSI